MMKPIALGATLLMLAGCVGVADGPVVYVSPRVYAPTPVYIPPVYRPRPVYPVYPRGGYIPAPPPWATPWQRYNYYRRW